MSPPLPDTDAYRLAFELAPVGLALSRHRIMVDCNQAMCEMFGASREELVGQSFRILYPSADEFERIGERIAPILNAHGHYSDERIMRRVGGRLAGQTFWCHVSGRALDRTDPHAAGIWSFEDVSARRPVTAALTAREREVAALVMKGLTAKQAAKALGISPRTVEIYRARLMRKFHAASTVELVQKLLLG
ncbi:MULTISPECIES: LuxR C-terminal-related transcriptional regulator [Tepidimonas]|uniref:Tetrathionate response regulatory protein TtrR n=2 Tax=Tepidimonas TaxID=114248 RepID=A0A554X1V3_9BURK|nr:MULTISPECIES: LuxR C-terminal-related transcriptional regulator [Tepidimonas]MCX7693692.1 LuxR C-terminal-related transcriptional regulator [Tepidimonas taiwanensis]MDM7463702.1 LuxR C-terminal-related transcriptional regulator [Tepidimonas taiwanensis]TSE29820.1 Tetrathionate response regulatory protein TtrR [Tepidimonas taiwanensis]TSE32609.1 Tetrathionate response regulatory protein TtrR [Tepidimonas charontis]UBQ04575.1 LuxR C-terminal-related transcriptional regulator [Tepidimonas taiw